MFDEQVPEAEDGKGVSVRVVAGTALGISSPVRTITPTYYLGIVMTMMTFLASHHSYIYMYHRSH